MSPELARHVPVLARELIELVDPRPGETLVDATLGGGGHARLITERIGSAGKLIGLDQDRRMLERAGVRLAGLPVEFVQANFDQLVPVLDERGIREVDGLIADLGFGCPELGSFSLSEIASVRLAFGLGIERDITFEGLFPLSLYAEAARLRGSILEAERGLRAMAAALGDTDPELPPPSS